MLLLAIVSFTEINDVFWGQMDQQITKTEKKTIFPHLSSNEIEKSPVHSALYKQLHDGRPVWWCLLFRAHFSNTCIAAHLFLHSSCLFLIKFTELPLLFLIMHIQINAQSAATTRSSMAVIFLLGSRYTESVASIMCKQDPLTTYPAALPDPVAQPPVTEGYAASGGEEEEDVDEEDDCTSCCFDVGSIHRPGNCSRAFLFSFHQLF